MAVLALLALLATGAVATAVTYGNELKDRHYDVARRIAERRAALELGRSSVDESGLALVEKRKREAPASVIVLEAMSQILPDHTYLTELRVLGDKLQIVGITRDAPSLIRLIEQSSHFSQATFFAPTTRSPSEAGEHFNIEARIEPVYTPGP
jgi:general secretion pathway protein L